MTNGEDETPKPEKGKKAKPKKRRGVKKAARNRSSKKPPTAPLATRARARDPDKRPEDLPSLDDLQRQVRIEVLLERLADEGEEITVAARACKIDRKTIWRWRKEIPWLDDALAEAYRVGTESLVEVARSRAKDGWEEPVYQGGQLVGKKRVYDHNLLSMIIRKRDPSFRDPKWAVPVTPPRNPGEISLDLDRIEDPALMAALEKEARRQAQAKQVEPAR